MVTFNIQPFPFEESTLRAWIHKHSISLLPSTAVRFFSRIPAGKSELTDALNSESPSVRFTATMNRPNALSELFSNL